MFYCGDNFWRSLIIIIYCSCKSRAFYQWMLHTRKAQFSTHKSRTYKCLFWGLPTISTFRIFLCLGLLNWATHPFSPQQEIKQLSYYCLTCLLFMKFFNRSIQINKCSITCFSSIDQMFHVAHGKLQCFNLGQLTVRWRSWQHFTQCVQSNVFTVRAVGTRNSKTINISNGRL